MVDPRFFNPLREYFATRQRKKQEEKRIYAEARSKADARYIAQKADRDSREKYLPSKSSGGGFIGGLTGVLQGMDSNRRPSRRIRVIKNRKSRRLHVRRGRKSSSTDWIMSHPKISFI